MGRIFSYHDTHLHRIGPNYEQLPINAPKASVDSYNQDGSMAYEHSGGRANYAPNSFDGPVADPGSGADLGWHVGDGQIGRYAYTAHSDDDDFVQPGTMYREVMNATEQEHLAQNIIGHASDGVTPEMQARVVEYWTKVDPGLGGRIADGLGVGRAAPTNIPGSVAD